MNHVERVKRAFHFDKPDKVPIFYVGLGTDFWPAFSYDPPDFQPTEYPPHIWGGPSYYSTKLARFLYYKWDNIHRKNLGLPKKWWNHEKNGELLTIDEWGIIWKSGSVKRDKTMGHPYIGPFQESYDNIDEYQPPDAKKDSRYHFWRGILKQSGKGRYLYGGPMQAFIYDHASFLRGFTNIMLDFRKNPNQVQKLANMVADFFCDAVEKIKEVIPELNAIFALDDLGTQKGPILSPKMFRRFFFDPYKRVIDLTHDLGMDFILHCCGSVLELFPTFIDLGIDVMEFDQPNVTGVENYKKFAEQQKMAFFLSSDLQTTYTLGTPEEIEEEVKYYVKEIGNNYGGLAFSSYPDNRAIDAPRANIRAFIKAARKWGNYNMQGKIKWLV